MQDAPYSPVEGDADYEIVGADYDHYGTGQQGLLLQAKQGTQMKATDGALTPYFYMLYNPRRHASEDGSMFCDLKEMDAGSEGEPYKIIYLETRGEGLVRGNTITLESVRSMGSYPGDGCDFALMAVHSRGTLPDDAWGRANVLWQSSVNASIAQKHQQKRLEQERDEKNQKEIEAIANGAPANSSY